jgi:hypothetical protein
LRSIRPDGWSVVQGDRELVMRPAERALGKFSVTVSPARPGFKFCLMFFSRSLNHWDGHEYYDPAQDNAAAMVDWALAKLEGERALSPSFPAYCYGQHWVKADIS